MTKHKSKAQDILGMIRRRKQSTEETPWYEKEPDPEILRVTGQENPEEKMWAYFPDDPEAPLSADDWQEFKRKFVEEYGGEKVQDTGMTHSEFIQYLKDGTREGQSASQSASSLDSKKLKEMLKQFMLKQAKRAGVL